LRDETDRVWRLDVGAGQLLQVAESAERFRALSGTSEKEEAWFEADAQKKFAAMGLNPGREQCIAFKIPVVFAESRNMPDNAHVGDLYDCVSALGAIHRQIADLPDGGKVRLVVGREPGNP
jgi:hypothetical protein